MSIIKILDIVLILLLLIIGTETIIKLKKSENKKIDEIKNGLLTRINIIMVLTVLVSIVTILNIVLKK